MKIKLGTKNIFLVDELDIDPMGEYLISVIASPTGTFTPVKQGDEEVEQTISFKVVRPESVQKIGQKPVKVKRGSTPSQILRAVVFDYLKRVGKDATEEEYERVMTKITGKVEGWGLE